MRAALFFPLFLVVKKLSHKHGKSITFKAIFFFSSLRALSIPRTAPCRFSYSYLKYPRIRRSRRKRKRKATTRPRCGGGRGKKRKKKSCHPGRFVRLPPTPASDSCAPAPHRVTHDTRYSLIFLSFSEPPPPPSERNRVFVYFFFTLRIEFFHTIFVLRQLQPRPDSLPRFLLFARS